MICVGNECYGVRNNCVWDGVCCTQVTDVLLIKHIHFLVTEVPEE